MNHKNTGPRETGYHQEYRAERRSETFAKHVFNEDRMLQYLTREAFASVKGAIFSGSKIDRKLPIRWPRP